MKTTHNTLIGLIIFCSVGYISYSYWKPSHSTHQKNLVKERITTKKFQTNSAIKNTTQHKMENAYTEPLSVNSSKKNPYVKYLETQMHKSGPVREIMISDFRSILNPDSAVVNKAAENIRRRKALQVYDVTSPKMDWDPRNEPTNNREFHLGLQVVYNLHLRVLAAAAIDKNNEVLQMAAAGVERTRLLQDFEFVGKDKDGRSELRFRGKQFASRSLGSDRMTADAPLFDFESEDAQNHITDPSFTEAFSKQLCYFCAADVPWYSERTTYNQEDGDPLLKPNGIVKLADAIISLFSNSSVANTTEMDLHIANEDTIKKVLRRARQNPQAYGVNMNDPFLSAYIPNKSQLRMSFERKGVNDITDIDYVYFANEIIREQSFYFANIGAIGTLANHFFAESLNGNYVTMFLGPITFVGIEALLNSIGTYQGIRRLLTFQVYRSYLMQRKWNDVVIHRNPFDVTSASYKFKATFSQLDTEMKQEARRVWAYAFIGGTITRFFGSPKAVGVKWTINYIKAKAWALKMATLDIATSTQPQTMQKFFAYFYSKVFHATDYIKNLRILMPFVAVKNAIKQSKLASLVTNILGIGAKAIYIGTDTAITSATIYSMIYSRLHISGQILEDVHQSPMTSLQIALTDSSKGKDYFRTGTREILYPLCVYLAQKGIPMQSPAEDPEAVRRQNNCVRLIMAFEGIDNLNQLAERQPLLYAQLQTYSYFSVSDDQYKKTIELAQTNYPRYFRVTWLAALRSIYSIHIIPTLYWQTESLMMRREFDTEKSKRLFGIPGFARDLANTDLKTISELTNLRRLNYVIELLATKKAQSLKQQANPAVPQKLEELNPNDVDLTWAYIEYFKTAKQKVSSYLDLFEMVRTKINETDSNSAWWEHVEDGFANFFTEELPAVYDEIRFAFSQGIAPPESIGPVAEMEEEVLEIIGYPSEN